MPLEQEDIPHTPGPWSFDGCVQIVEVERPHMRVAFLPSDHSEYAASQANGRLIAGAPDLLEALRRIEHTLATHGKVDADTPLHEFVSAAIARATSNH